MHSIGRLFPQMQYCYPLFHRGPYIPKKSLTAQSLLSQSRSFIPHPPLPPGSLTPPPPSSVASKSRSATLLLAHLLATTPALTPASALAHLRASHPPADPNPGFMAQLALYHRMGCPSSLDTQPLYQRWRNERSAAESAAVGMAPQMDGIRYGDEVERGDSAPLSSLPGEEEEEKEEKKKKKNEEATYRCRRCRTPLATTAYLIPHTPSPTTSNTTPQSQKPHPHPHTHTPKQPCAHLFLDPLSWMRPELEKGKLEGRLECPKCGQNVGKYAWQGMRCSCAGWVVPGICLGRGRVDEVVGVGGKL